MNRLINVMSVMNVSCRTRAVQFGLVWSRVLATVAIVSDVSLFGDLIDIELRGAQLKHTKLKSSITVFTQSTMVHSEKKQ